MKKALCFLMMILLISFCTMAAGEKILLPESIDDFDLSVELPEGISVENEVQETEYSKTVFRAEGAAPVYVTVAFSELYAGDTLSEMSEESVEELVAILGEQYDTLYCEISDSENGIRFLRLYTGEDDTINSYFTMFNGLMVQLTQYNDDFSPISEADQNMINALLNAMAVVKP